MKKIPVVSSFTFALAGLLFVGPTIEAAPYGQFIFLPDGQAGAASRTPAEPDLPWNLRMINPPDLDLTNICPGVIVAVLDTGLWLEAAGLAGATVLAGRDFVNRDSDPRDDNGHGTHISSIIHRLCPDCPILPVKVLNQRGLGDVHPLARGIRFAVEKGASVINMSVGFDPGYEPGRELEEAVRFAVESGVILVASVGNEGRIGPGYPAAYPGVIAVAAVDYDGLRPAYSNLNPAVSVAAPGGDDRDRDGDGIPESILATGLALHAGGPEPWLYSGTSQAAAHVSGIAARLIGCGVLPDEVQPLLEATARDVDPPGFDIETGAGVIDFARAVSVALSGEPVYYPDRPERCIAGGVTEGQPYAGVLASPLSRFTARRP